ncbi:type II toxin-antitoxin system VapC family toxin [Pseudanabaena sp. ABRG5-3]|jgi:predicted nucleic acid-binding protein|uniref:type II toxin-antitoxin system VapC family toxin n=1 Tax=Pseudanabaena sp. ABRG5-3 TaxID=685565 RepID=UPI000DC73C4A|nr:PIN domain-containing protein [Pseudanabaena sp. ABRG5-3]BBC22865.1 PIN domain nucleic acid-binding protein [Pseudanabaena sp. ABRG5-3]
MKYPAILIDTSAFVAFYNQADKNHSIMRNFFLECDSKLVTSTSCITETVWMLRFNYRVQNVFLSTFLADIYIHESLTKQDLARIMELNEKYADRRADFADLSLVAISERLDIPAIATFDKDFQVYRRYRNQPFVNVLA